VTTAAAATAAGGTLLFGRCLTTLREVTIDNDPNRIVPSGQVAVPPATFFAGVALVIVIGIVIVANVRCDAPANLRIIGFFRWRLRFLIASATPPIASSSARALFWFGLIACEFIASIGFFAQRFVDLVSLRSRVGRAFGGLITATSPASTSTSPTSTGPLLRFSFDIGVFVDFSLIRNVFGKNCFFAFGEQERRLDVGSRRDKCAPPIHGIRREQGVESAASSLARNAGLLGFSRRKLRRRHIGRGLANHFIVVIFQDFFKDDVRLNLNGLLSTATAAIRLAVVNLRWTFLPFTPFLGVT
jgi:hypothetical protein